MNAAVFFCWHSACTIRSCHVLWEIPSTSSKCSFKTGSAVLNGDYFVELVTVPGGMPQRYSTCCHVKFSFEFLFQSNFVFGSRASASNLLPFIKLTRNLGHRLSHFSAGGTAARFYFTLSYPLRFWVPVTALSSYKQHDLFAFSSSFSILRTILPLWDVTVQNGVNPPSNLSEKVPFACILLPFLDDRVVFSGPV